MSKNSENIKGKKKAKNYIYNKLTLQVSQLFVDRNVEKSIFRCVDQKMTQHMHHFEKS